MNIKSEVMMSHISKYLCSHSKQNFTEIQKFAKENQIPSVHNLTGEFLHFMIKTKKTNHILELGCGIGLSTSYMLTKDIKSIDAVDMNEFRINKAKEFIKDKRVSFYNTSNKNFLECCNKKYDFVFVDTVKKDYLDTWYLIKPKLNKNAVIIFDDVLLYGFVANENAEIPQKYKNAVNELRIFIKAIFDDKNLDAFILPISDGVLLINYEI